MKKFIILSSLILLFNNCAFGEEYKTLSVTTSQNGKIVQLLQYNDDYSKKIGEKYKVYNIGQNYKIIQYNNPYNTIDILKFEGDILQWSKSLFLYHTQIKACEIDKNGSLKINLNINNQIGVNCFEPYILDDAITISNKGEILTRINGIKTEYPTEIVSEFLSNNEHYLISKNFAGGTFQEKEPVYLLKLASDSQGRKYFKTITTLFQTKEDINHVNISVKNDTVHISFKEWGDMSFQNEKIKFKTITAYLLHKYYNIINFRTKKPFYEQKIDITTDTGNNIAKGDAEKVFYNDSGSNFLLVKNFEKEKDFETAALIKISRESIVEDIKYIDNDTIRYNKFSLESVKYKNGIYKIKLSSPNKYFINDQIDVRQNGKLIKPARYIQMPMYCNQTIFIINNKKYILAWNSDAFSLFLGDKEKLFLIDGIGESQPWNTNNLELKVLDNQNFEIKAYNTIYHYKINKNQIYRLIPARERKINLLIYKKGSFNPQKHFDFEVDGNQYWILEDNLIVKNSGDYYHLGSILNNQPIPNNFKIMSISTNNPKDIVINTNNGPCHYNSEAMTVKAPSLIIEKKLLQQQGQIQTIEKLWSDKNNNFKIPVNTHFVDNTNKQK